jgi:hypothetical protein
VLNFKSLVEKLLEVKPNYDALRAPASPTLDHTTNTSWLIAQNDVFSLAIVPCT